MSYGDKVLASGNVRRSDVDLLKGAAIVGVLFAHASFYSRFDPDTIELVKLMQRLIGWCVIAFFYLAGTLAKPVRSWGQLRSFVVARFSRLLLPCVVFSFSYNVIIGMLSHLDLVGQGHDLGGSVLSFLRFFLPASPQFYFLPYLFLISVAVHLADFVFRPPASFLLALGLLVLAYSMIDLPAHSYGSDADLFPIYIYAYAAGHFGVLALTGSQWFNVSVQCLFPSLCALLYASPIFLYLLVPVLLLVVFRMFGRGASVGLGVLGRWSGGIYVWHAPIVMPAASIVAVSAFGGGLVGLAATMLLTIAVSVSLAWVTCRVEWLRPWRF